MTGKTDCLGPVVVSWNVIGNYVFVHVEEYTGKWWYRIFISRDEFCYERNRVLDPKPGYDDLLYVYGYYENIRGEDRELQHFEKGDWLHEMKAKISGEVQAMHEW